MRVLLLTGPGGDAQGWGDMNTTRAVGEAAEASGHSARIAYVESEEDFRSVIGRGDFDIVWSALYHLTPNEKIIGTNESGTWVADVLDGKGIPYVGSGSQTMKHMIDKYRTHTLLASRGVPCPAHHLVQADEIPPAITYPAFVKPLYESRSVGISDDSVVYSDDELRRRAAYVHREFGEAALVEDFLPGDEFTVLVLGNGDSRVCLPGLVTVDGKHYGRHRILRSDLRGVGLTHIRPPGPRAAEVGALGAAAADALGCLDHVRIDIKADAAGVLKTIEVNGIPGLKPRKSWAPQLYTLHHASPGGEMEDYRKLIAAIIDSARRRYGL